MSAKSKRGVCIPWNFDPADFSIYQTAIDSGKISWLSNWEMWKPKGLPSNITYVPQCRTANEANQINDYLKGYENDNQVQGFMGFNEPDIATQANLSVEKAVELWKQHIAPLKERYSDLRIGSPAVSNGPAGLPWLRTFFEQLGGVKESGVDYVVIHYYSPDHQHFKQYVAEAHEAFGLPVWITEIACTRWDPANPCGEEEVCTFMKEATQFLEDSDFVERYAWFGAMVDVGDGVGRANGLQKDGRLSAAGSVYCS